MTSVRHRDSFLVVGGYAEVDHHVATIYKYDVDTEGWIRMAGELSRNRTSVAAMTVDIGMFPEC